MLDETGEEAPAWIDRTITWLEAPGDRARTRSNLNQRSAEMNSASPGRPADEEVADNPPDGASAEAPAVGELSTSSTADPPRQAPIPLPGDEIDNWAERAEKAAVAARAARTAEAWREAGQLSLVVADVIFALQSELDANRRASEAARIAEGKAKAAAAALQEAQRATSTARDIHDAVARARDSGTPDAWQLAARVGSAIARALGAGAVGDEFLSHPGQLPAPDSGEQGTVTQIGQPAGAMTARRRAWGSSDS